MPPSRRDLLASVHPLAKELRRIEDQAAADYGVTMWQYAILSVVSDSPGLNQGQVARNLQYSANRIVADLDELQERGLLVREPGQDRRANQLHVTEAGAALQRKVQHDVHDREDDLLAGLSPTRQRQLRAALQQLAQQMRADS